MPLPPAVRPLPGAAAEARMVAQVSKQVTGSRVASFESRAATRAAVLAALRQTGRALTHAHFACHGQAAINEPQLSGLLLADGEQLTVRDLLDPDGARFEQLRLCVLSACQTGIVGTDLPDEVTGLSAGWLQAGSAGVVASLWPVSDQATLALMAKFYELHWLDQLQPGDALWLAQRWLRGLPTWRQDLEKAGAALGARGPEAAEAVREIASSQARAQQPAGQADPAPFDSPVYWAAFVLHGS
jgi:CHAT domain-containing protein